MAVVLWAAGLVACASTTSPTGARRPPLDEVPYRIDYMGWITVEAEVNGQGPYDFIVDSGATITAVFANLAAQSNFTKADRPPIRILGLAGARELPAYVIGDVTVSNSKLAIHVGVILPDWEPPNKPPHGVLGLDFLAQFKTLFDNQDQTIKIYAINATPDHAMRGWTRTSLRPLIIEGEGRPLYSVNVDVRGAQIPCIVDLGASGTIFNVAAYRRITGGLVFNGSRKDGFKTGSRIQDVFDNLDEAIALRVGRMRIGSATWLNKTVIVYDAHLFEEFGFKDSPICLIGADLFADRSFMLDFSGETLHIGPGRRR